VRREVQELERGIEIAERAVQLGRDEIIKEAEADPHQFNQLAALRLTSHGFARSATRSWLLMERGVTRDPTPQELENGAYFANHAEYAAAGGLTE
jgi:hypothetical protein